MDDLLASFGVLSLSFGGGGEVSSIWIRRESESGASLMHIVAAWGGTPNVDTLKSGKHCFIPMQ